jgi:hypothetical protein
MNSASHSSDYIVDLCFNTSGCQGNFTSNQLIIDLATNQVWQLTNFFDQGSALNLAFMSGPNFGGTARVSYDPTAKTILTNVQNSLINYTVLWPLSFQGSPVNFQATFGGTTTARGSTTIR